MRVERHARDGEQLVLSGPDVELRFDPVAPEEDAALVGTDWQLESLISGTGPDGAVSSTMAPARLRLDDDGTFSAGTGCNGLTGRWEGDEDGLRLLPGDRGDDGCEEGVEAQQEHVEAVLRGDVRVDLDGRRLTLTRGERGLDYRAD
jgi:heat shock protein HslJ